MKKSFIRGASKPWFGSVAQKNFSLLVPLQTNASVPAELSITPLTDRHFSELKAKYTTFNA